MDTETWYRNIEKEYLNDVLIEQTQGELDQKQDEIRIVEEEVKNLEREIKKRIEEASKTEDLINENIRIEELSKNKYNNFYIIFINRIREHRVSRCRFIQTILPPKVAKHAVIWWTKQ